MKRYILLGILIGILLSLIWSDYLPLVCSSSSNVIKHTFRNQLLMQFPHSTRVVESNINENGELIYSAYFDDQTQLVRGYIQLWKLDDLEGYLTTSKRASSFDFKSYVLRPIEVAKFDGYLTEWSASFGESYKISGREYWLKKPDTNNVLRASFFTDSSKFSTRQMNYINEIVNSLDVEN